MKKIKYILGVFSFILLGISFTNGAGDIIPVKNVFPGSSTMMYISSLSNEDYISIASCPAGTSNFGYSVLGTDFIVRLGDSQGSYNTSLFSYISNNVNSYTNTSMSCNNGISSINFGDGSVLFGNCGNNYIGLGNGYLDINNYSPYNRSDVDFLKLFYTSGTFSNFNMNNLNNSSNTSFSDWLAVGKYNSYYEDSYIQDLPVGSFRYSISDLNGLGYSYVYLDTTGDSISWSDLHFATVSNSALSQRISQVGGKSFQTLVDGQIVVPRFLEIKDIDSNNVYFFSKINGDYSSLAYQHFICSDGYSDSIGDVMYGNNCVSSSFGIIPNALPFTDETTPVSKSSLTYFLSYLLDVRLIDIDFNYYDSSLYFYSLGIPALCENTHATRTYLSSMSFPFQASTSGQSIQMYYLSNYSQTLPPLPSDSSNTGSSSNNPYASWYYQCLGPSYNTPDGLPPAFCLDSSGNLIDYELYKDCYFEPSVNENGVFENHFYCNQGGFIQEMDWVAEGSGGVFVPCTGENCGSTLVVGPNYLSSEDNFSLSTGLALDMITNITGRIAKCPYPYTDFRLGENSSLLRYLTSLGFKYDPFIFVNCVVAGFHHGRHIIDHTLSGDTIEQPLLYGDTSKHRSLFAFLDFVIILGLFGFMGFIKKIF